MGKIWIEQGNPASRATGVLHFQPFNVSHNGETTGEHTPAAREEAPHSVNHIVGEPTQPQPMHWQDTTDPIEARIAQRAGTLSNAERNVCVFIKKNASSKDIASQLGISKHTVDTHRKNIRRKLGLHEKESLYSVLVRI